MESLQAFYKFLFGSLLCSTNNFLQCYHCVASSRELERLVLGCARASDPCLRSLFFESRHVQTQILAPPHSLRLARQVLLKHPVFVLSANSQFSLAPDCWLTVASKFNTFLVAFVQKQYMVPPFYTLSLWRWLIKIVMDFWFLMAVTMAVSSRMWRNEFCYLNFRFMVPCITYQY